METDDSQEEEQGIFALPSLGEDETIARLATGIKRFKLPDEFNYIKIYQQVADDAAKSDARRRGPGTPGPHLREPPAISQGGRLLAAADPGLSAIASEVEGLASSSSSRSWPTGAASSR